MQILTDFASLQVGRTTSRNKTIMEVLRSKTSWMSYEFTLDVLELSQKYGSIEWNKIWRP